MVLSVAELQKHPEFPYTIWKLEPTATGKHTCGAKSGGAGYKIAYNVYGKGQRKLVLIMGLGGIMSSWQRQIKDFANPRDSDVSTQSSHDDTEYQVLVVDNRGIGLSDKPLFRATSSNLAADVIEIVDMLGWTAPRQLNVAGISLGGMIAQELAFAIPERINSLALVSTAARLVNTVGFLENLQQRAQLFIPKSLDEQIRGSLARQFTQEYVNGPDNIKDPKKTAFPTGGDRYAAAEVIKKTTPGFFTRRGFINQALAAAGHKKSAAQLQTLAERVGRRRILVLHGTKDQMITFPHGETLVRELNTGGKDAEDVVEAWFIEGQGHVVPVELRDEFNDRIRGLVARAEALSE